jgi:hypothetical protein
LKKFLLFALLTQLAAYTAKAQVGYNYAQYGLGISTGVFKASTDVPNQKSHAALAFNFNYYTTPYVNFTLEYQFGKVSGGAIEAIGDSPSAEDLANYLKTDPYLRSYSNSYKHIMLYADVQAGEIMDYSNDGFLNKALRNFYLGTGIGMIYNKMDYIQRNSPDDTYVYGGLDKGTNVVIPARFGYQFKIYNAYDEPAFLVDLGYQKNFVLGYGLDGYADPILVTKSYESYSAFHIGVKFNFGTVVSYRKPIH